MADRDPLIGTVIGDRYRLTRTLGKGGFGAVYEAEHVSLDRRFAVKILQRHLDADPSFVRRFEREARLTSRLDHPNVIQVTDFGHDERLGTYFVMELLRGEDLQQRIRRVGPMDSNVAVSVMRQIVDAFVYAHGQGVIHRDVKSANVFLASDTTRKDFVKVLDFGIARLSDPTAGDGDARLTRTGAVVGSPAYMAPEQALALQVDHRTDIYSLGIVFYEMVTGRVPFTATSAFEVINKQIKDAPAAPSEIRPDLNVHPYLELVILQCLRKKMDERFQQTQELADALAQAEDQIKSGGSTPAQVMGTLTELRLAMLSDGSLLAESTEQDRRRIVGGQGFAQVQSELAGTGNRKLLALAAAVFVCGALLLGGVWAWKKGGDAQTAVARPTEPGVVVEKPSAPAPVPLPKPEPPAAAAPVPAVVEAPQPSTPSAPAPAEPLQVIVTTDPLGGVFRWAGDAQAPQPTPAILSLVDTDEGRVLILSKPGFLTREVPVRLASIRSDRRLIVPLERARPREPREAARKAEPPLPPVLSPPTAKKPIVVDDDPYGNLRE